MALEAWQESLHWSETVRRYSARLHDAAGPDSHHIVSPVGAWLLLALTGGLAGSDPAASADLADALGCNPAEAADVAGRLLTQPHPKLDLGVGLWSRGGRTRIAREWRRTLPAAVSRGAIPSPSELDRWAVKNSKGQFQRYPSPPPADNVCLIASVVATRVPWWQPFHVVSSSELAADRWFGGLRTVLLSHRKKSHLAFIVDTPTAGLVGVHEISDFYGMRVTSVIAEDPTVPAAAVLAEAEEIATRLPSGPPGNEVPLGDLPLGQGAAWDIFRIRRAVPRHGSFTTVMPSWSASSSLDLGGARTGFEAASRLLARAHNLSPYVAGGTQSVTARFTANGFKAAAVTDDWVARSVSRETENRRAWLLFRHPFAVVATTRGISIREAPLWHAMPAFSAWITEGVDA